MKTINFTPKSKTLLLGLSLVISFISFPFLSNSQSVAIKDSKFEKALVDLKIDKDGLNGSLRLADVDTVSRLIIANKGITDLTGIEAFKNLKLLNCDSNLLTFIKFINLPNLVEVHCANNKFVGLDFSHNNSLKSLDCKNNQLTSLNISNDSSSKFVQFLATGNPNLRIICVDDKSFATVNFLNIDLGVTFNDINCKTGIIPDLIFETNLVKLNIDKNGLTGTILYSDADNVLSLNLKNLGINDITGISFFKSLKNFDCSGNNLKAFDLSALQDITNLNCYNNKITSLDISKNEKIERLICSYNDLNTLLIDSNLSLRYINCEYNKLSLLNIEGLAGLDSLICDNNQIIDLSLFGLNITYLNCSNNKLSAINVMFMSKLTDLLCTNNFLKNLNFSGNINLRSIFCYYNNITIMSVANLPELVQLFCDFNSLSNLDLSNNPKLVELNCKNNNLTKLSIKNGNNKNMTTCVTYFNDNLKEICTDDAKFASLNFLQKPAGAVYLDRNCINTSSVRGTAYFNGKIYPNPFKGSFILESNQKVESLSITNLLGQAIAYSTVFSMDKVEIHVDSPGVYILNYKSGNNNYQYKVISY